MELVRQAVNAERNNNWREAARLWALCGRKEDHDACIYIADANDLGDHYRKRVLDEAGEEPDKSLNPHAWVKWYDKMNSIYNEIYRK